MVLKYGKLISVTMFGVSINNNLKFDNHVSNLCNKAGRKLSALTRLANTLLLHKMRNINEILFQLNSHVAY